ncbi:MAG: thioredoxin-disulfide reductase [candidate division WOR-3 bacterium]
MIDFTFSKTKIEDEYEAIIIGGGPAGLTCGLYLSRALVKVLLIEKKVLGGNAILTSAIENYPGLDQVSGQELIDRIVKQVQRYRLPILYEAVKRIELIDDRFLVETSTSRIRCQSVVLAVGTSYRKLGVPGEAEYTGRGVSYCATCDGMFFQGKVIAVVGGGDSALKESLYLARIVKEIYLIHRRKEFRAERIVVEEVLRTKNIRPVLEKKVVSINGRDRVDSITLTDVNTGAIENYAVDGVFINIGHNPDTEFLKGLLNLDEHGYIVSDCLLRTNVPGLFVAGDARVSEQRQIATAVGDGAMAAAMVEKYLGRR